MSQPDALIVGIDAGGSTVRCVAARGGTIVGRGSAGPANATASGVGAAAGAIVSAIHAATGQDVIASLYAGAAGAGHAAVAAELRGALQQRLAGAPAIVVEDDTRIALRAAITSGPGVVVIAGTGSVAYGENGKHRVRIGGEGFLIGDDGSGFSIGRTSVRMLARAYDGRDSHDETTRTVEEKLAVHDRDGLLTAIYAAESGHGVIIARIAALAQEVVALAQRGNERSLRVVDDAADALANLAIDAARLLGLEAPSIALTGGLLTSRNVLVDAVERRCRAALARCTFDQPRMAPEIAAVMLAGASLRDTVMR